MVIKSKKIILIFFFLVVAIQPVRFYAGGPVSGFCKEYPIASIAIVSGLIMMPDKNQLLLWAIQMNSLYAAQFLLVYGANTNIQDQHGNTAFHEAVLYGHPEIIKLLLAHKSCSK